MSNLRPCTYVAFRTRELCRAHDASIVSGSRHLVMRCGIAKRSLVSKRMLKYTKHAMLCLSLVLLGVMISSYYLEIDYRVGAERKPLFSVAQSRAGAIWLGRASTTASAQALTHLKAIRSSFGCWWPEEVGLRLSWIEPPGLSGGEVRAPVFPRIQESKAASPCSVSCVCGNSPCLLSQAQFVYTWVDIPYWCIVTPFVALTVVLFWRSRPFPPGACSNCGYSLRGLTSRKCPECGLEKPEPPLP